MPKLILRCNYLKNAPPSQLSNYINYIGTREGAEKVADTMSQMPATAAQKKVMQEILHDIPDAARMHEYYDYLQRPTRENASEFITQALENNIDLIAKKKNYIDYLANRPGVEKTGTHGLFSNEGEAVVLSRVMNEVAEHKGVVWTNVISLRREDAERLGYDSGVQWQALLRSRVALLCEQYNIDSRNLKWYAAFHNESHHPHVHLVLYSTRTSEGHLTKKGIDAMRSTYAHDIFRQEFASLYEQKDFYRKQIKEQAEESLLFLLKEMQKGFYHNAVVAEKMELLSKRLMNTGGKKVYGYLKKDVKVIVNGIVDELSKDERVSECYEKWLESKEDILRYYKDTMPIQPPLSEQKELKSIKNMVIREAVRYGKGELFLEDDDMEKNEDAALESADGIHPESKLLESEQETERNAHTGYEADKMYRLANLYLKQEEEEKELHAASYQPNREKIEKAVAWLKKSAEDQNSNASYKLGKLYLTGEHVVKDTEIAVRYLENAAEQNNAYAQYILGKLYYSGEEVGEDKETAYAYFLKASEQGNQYAAFFIEHWDELTKPDLFLMATRLVKHLAKTMEDDVKDKKRGGSGMTDSKLRRKMKAKKVAQGHAEDDRESPVLSQ